MEQPNSCLFALFADNSFRASVVRRLPSRVALVARRALGEEASVDQEAGSIDVVGQGRTKEEDHVADVVGDADPPRGDRPDGVIAIAAP